MDGQNLVTFLPQYKVLPPPAPARAAAAMRRYHRLLQRRRRLTSRLRAVEHQILEIEGVSHADGDFLENERKQVVIDKVFEETFRSEPTPKVVMTIIGDDGWQRDLTINQTNGRTLATAFGDEMDEWVGQTIEVFVVDTTFNNVPTKGLRVAPVSPTQPLLPGTPPPIKGNDLDDDKIPF